MATDVKVSTLWFPSVFALLFRNTTQIEEQKRALKQYQEGHDTELIVVPKGDVDHKIDIVPKVVPSSDDDKTNIDFKVKCKQSALQCRQRARFYTWWHLLFVLIASFCGAASGIIAGLSIYWVGIITGGVAALVNVTSFVLKFGTASETYAHLALEFALLGRGSPDISRYNLLCHQAQYALSSLDIWFEE